MLQLPGFDFVEQTCWHEFLEASIRLVAGLDSRLKETHGLTLFDVLVLDLLARGSVRKCELAEALMQPPEEVTLQIRHLKTKGLIGHWPAPYDGGTVLVSITRAGQVRADAARKTYAEEVRIRYLDRMSHQQMTALADNHRRINTPLKAVTSTPERDEWP